MSPASDAGLRRIVFGTFLGQVAEWYDYSIYALVAVQIGNTFFPSTDPRASLLSALAVFGVAFLARPIGGMVIGFLGDLAGRRTVLVLSLVLMTGATGVVALLPGFGTIGIWAPILLMVARFLQGLSAAGEATSSITFVAESVPPHRKGLFAALLMSGNSAGFFLATAVTWAFEEALGAPAFNDGGWRVTFLLSVPLGLVGLYIRRHLRESPVFEELRDTGALSRTPLRDTFTTGFGQLLQAIGMSAVSMIANYLLVAYMPLHLRDVGLSSSQAFLATMTASITLLISYPFMGALSDRIGRRPMLIGAATYLMISAWPLVSLTQSGEFSNAIICVVFLALGTAAFISCLGLYCTEYIDESRRMTTYSTGFNLCAAIFGGSSLWMFGKLVEITGDTRMPAAYLSLAAAISLVSVLSIRSTRGTSAIR